MAETDPAPQIAQLVAEHHQVMFRYAYRLAGSAADAEDLTQQTFLVAQQRIGQVRDLERVRGWLFAILRSCYLKGRRKRHPLVAVDIELDVHTIPEKSVPQAVDSQQLQQALDSLEDDFRIVILLFYFEYRSYRSIAEVLEIPIGTVMSRLARAKAQLRRRLCELDPALVGTHVTPKALFADRHTAARSR